MWSGEQACFAGAESVWRRAVGGITDVIDGKWEHQSCSLR